MSRRLVLCVPFLYQTTLTSETLNSSDDINVCSIKTANHIRLAPPSPTSPLLKLATYFMCTDLVASGGFFRYSSVLIYCNDNNIFLGEASTPQIP